MLTSSQVDNLRPFIEKYKPFALLYAPKEPGEDSQRTETIVKKQTPFTYKNCHGASLLLKKKTYKWVDDSEFDSETGKVTKFVEARLVIENGDTYQFSEAYDRCEFERIAYAEAWPSTHTIAMMTSLPEKLEKELEDASKKQNDIEQNNSSIEKKVATVVSNYQTLYAVYSAVRFEITSMITEVPALEGTPFEPKYFRELVPVITNVAAVEFPEVSSNVFEQAKA